MFRWINQTQKSELKFNYCCQRQHSSRTMQKVYPSPLCRTANSRQHRNLLKPHYSTISVLMRLQSVEKLSPLYFSLSLSFLISLHHILLLCSAQYNPIEIAEQCHGKSIIFIKSTNIFSYHLLFFNGAHPDSVNSTVYLLHYGMGDSSPDKSNFPKSDSKVYTQSSVPFLRKKTK